MADTAENVRTMLMTPQVVGGTTVGIGTAVGGRIHVDHSPQLDKLLDGRCQPTDIKPWIWIGRGSTSRDSCTDEAGTLPDVENFDVEIVARDQATVKQLAAQVHRLDSLRTMFDTGGMTGTRYDVFVEDQSDDFEDRIGAVELGLFMSALSIQVIRNG